MSLLHYLNYPGEGCGGHGLPFYTQFRSSRKCVFEKIFPQQKRRNFDGFGGLEAPRGSRLLSYSTRVQSTQCVSWCGKHSALAQASCEKSQGANPPPSGRPVVADFAP